eukprot:jgi/Galph1/4682/GphlegSOOS_G3407.1
MACPDNENASPLLFNRNLHWKWKQSAPRRKWFYILLVVLFLLLTVFTNYFWSVEQRPQTKFLKAGQEWNLPGSASSYVEFFHLSDIHLDPLYQPARHTEGVSCRYENVCSSPVWEYDNISSFEFPFGRVGCDPPLLLVESMLQKMKQICASPAFILFTGDAVAHQLTCRNLHRQTLLKWVQLVRDYFPNTIFIPVIGNNDLYWDENSSCQEMQHQVVEQQAELYSLFFPEDSIVSSEFLGSYIVSICRGLRILVYNSLWFSGRFWNREKDVTSEWSCSFLNDHPFSEHQQKWLINELEEASKVNDRVILASHIAPGIKTSHYNWCSKFTRWFSSLVTNYSSTIVTQFYGDHTNDEFRVLRFHPKNASCSLFIHSGLTCRRETPGNPSFRKVIVQVTEQETFLKDYTVYAFPIQEVNWLWRWNGTFPSVGQWIELYRFCSLYKVESMKIEEIVGLIERMQNDFYLVEKYLWALTVGGIGTTDITCTLCDILYLEETLHATCCYDPVGNLTSNVGVLSHG